MNLLLTLPYCAKDSDLLKKCLAWMAELHPEGYPSHSCLLVADSAVAHTTKLELQGQAKTMFQTAATMIVQVPQPKQNWPEGPNFMFAAASRQIAESYRMPWLWFEPDAVPLCRQWLDAIAVAYQNSPRRFLGSLVPSNGQADMPPIYLAGCAVYDTQAYHGMHTFTEGKKAFDIAAAPYTEPRAINTVLMQHFWGQPDLPPTFAMTPTSESSRNTLSLDIVHPAAVMFHRCKDGSLIDVLRQKLNSQPVKTVRRKSPARPVPAVEPT